MAAAEICGRRARSTEDDARWRACPVRVIGSSCEPERKGDGEEPSLFQSFSATAMRASEPAVAFPSSLLPFHKAHLVLLRASPLYRHPHRSNPPTIRRTPPPAAPTLIRSRPHPPHSGFVGKTLLHNPLIMRFTLPALFGAVATTFFAATANATFDLTKRNNMVLYWGQNSHGAYDKNSSKQQKSLLTYCKGWWFSTIFGTAVRVRVWGRAS